MITIYNSSIVKDINSLQFNSNNFGNKITYSKSINQETQSFLENVNKKCHPDIQTI